MTMLAPQAAVSPPRTNAHQRNREWPISGGRSSADGVQTSAQAALQSARRLSNWFSSIFGHSAPNVDRPNRVQLAEEGGCRVTSNNEIKGSRSTAEKDVPAGTMAVVRSPDFLPALKETALATLIHQRRLTPSRGGQAPTAERTVGPARMIAESLAPKPGIREQYRDSSAVV